MGLLPATASLRRLFSGADSGQRGLGGGLEMPGVRVGSIHLASVRGFAEAGPYQGGMGRRSDRDPGRSGGGAWSLACSVHGVDLIQRRSSHDDVPGPDPGLHYRAGFGDRLVGSDADGVRHPCGAVAPQSVQDAVDRGSKAIDPAEGDHR